MIDKARIRKSTYAGNGTLAIVVDNDMYWSPITHNIEDAVMSADNKRQYVPVGSNDFGVALVEWLEENGYAESTDIFEEDGYSFYLLMDFSKSIENIPTF